MSNPSREIKADICMNFYLLNTAVVFSIVFICTQLEVLKFKYSCPPLGLPNNTIKDHGTCIDPVTNISTPADINKYSDLLQNFVCIPAFIIAVVSVALAACLLELTIRRFTAGHTPVQKSLQNFLYESRELVLGSSQQNLSAKKLPRHRHNS